MAQPELTTDAQQPAETVAPVIGIKLESETPAAVIAEIEKKIFHAFSSEQFNLALDLSKVKLAPTKLIVFLINATSQARRLGGDIKLLNTSAMVKNNMVTFSPTTFLSLEPSEKYALYDFGEKVDLTESPFAETELPQMPEAEEEQTKKLVVEEESQKKSILPILAGLNLNDSKKIRVNSSPENLYQICDFVVQRARKAGFDEHEIAKIKVTVYEASLNVVEHAYFSNPDYWIDVYAVEKDSNFYMVIHDWGTSFDFDPTRDYNVEQAVKERKTGGFGLHIIKRTVDEIYYLSDQKIGNRLILIKKIMQGRGEKTNEN